MADKAESLPQAFAFHPEWWWDPIPPWVGSLLDQRALKELTVIQLEARKTMLEANLKATQKTLDVVQKAK